MNQIREALEAAMGALVCRNYAAAERNVQQALAALPDVGNCGCGADRICDGHAREQVERLRGYLLTCGWVPPTTLSPAEPAAPKVTCPPNCRGIILQIDYSGCSCASGKLANGEPQPPDFKCDCPNHPAAPSVEEKCRVCGDSTEGHPEFCRMPSQRKPAAPSGEKCTCNGFGGTYCLVHEAGAANPPPEAAATCSVGMPITCKEMMAEKEAELAKVREERDHHQRAWNRLFNRETALRAKLDKARRERDEARAKLAEAEQRHDKAVKAAVALEGRRAEQEARADAAEKKADRIFGVLTAQEQRIAEAVAELKDTRRWNGRIESAIAILTNTAEPKEGAKP